MGLCGKNFWWWLILKCINKMKPFLWYLGIICNSHNAPSVKIERDQYVYAQKYLLQQKC